MGSLPFEKTAAASGDRHTRSFGGCGGGRLGRDLAPREIGKTLGSLATPFEAGARAERLTEQLYEQGGTC